MRLAKAIAVMQQKFIHPNNLSFTVVSAKRYLNGKNGEWSHQIQLDPLHTGIQLGEQIERGKWSRECNVSIIITAQNCHNVESFSLPETGWAVTILHCPSGKTEIFS